MQNNVTRS